MLTDALKNQIRQIHQQLKSNLANYQPRPGQNKMVAEIANTLAGSYHTYDRTLLVEAGTGTGKSLAYLMAAIPFALKQKKTLVIATATVALQEQLVQKDLPFFLKHSGLKFEFCLVKGRQRYACIEKIKQQLLQPDLLPLFQSTAPAPLLQQLLNHWQQRLWLGDRDSLKEPVTDEHWYGIASDPAHCTKAHSAHHHCPFHLARAEIEGSTVLVVNHALLLADLDAGSQILPEPADCIYVIDEAHHLPDSGRDFFSAHAPMSFPAQWLEKLKKTTQQLAGILPQQGAMTEVLKLDELASDFLKQLKPVQHQIELNQHRWFTKESHYRFADAVLPETFASNADQLAELSGKALACVEKLQQFLSEAGTEHKVATKLVLPLQFELTAIEHRFEQQSELWRLYSVPQQKHVNQARWLSADNLNRDSKQRENLQSSAYASPLSVSFLLDDLLFSQAFATVLCSATLTTLNSFDYIKQELGLAQHPGLQTLKVDSPFDYRNKARLLLPKMQTDPSSDAFTDELIDKLPTYMDKVAGNLVLFASYWQMQKVTEALRAKGWSFLVQGEASRQSLLELHSMKVKAGEGSILCGTQSFSEGLDLPGALLTNLVITKLPFAVPSSPLEEALSEAITKRGGNPFLQMTVPATARKLVQACGRLLRQEQDYGRIVILDRRLVTKTYGKAMLKALPPFSQIIEE
ncbi:ATP-dependent DNA helicase DinG [Rheinheimera sediminis]|uniref:ATP-dependent DNA helicase DinG n=1 Tax=Rheinheimera sp. YQF-1 TaxID=2499626 RepID=UPI000FDC7BCF|nr:ATP-dependent DNA helicase DinG [Rheinheimera sp. YQF-1]RVT46215.1 ATP-dependent DNA helicase DinG [Rheinheimera sp. YQF-1]